MTAACSTVTDATGWAGVTDCEQAAMTGDDAPPVGYSYFINRHRPMTIASTFAARLADLQQRSDKTDKAAASALQQLKAHGQDLADAMAGLAAAMKN